MGTRVNGATQFKYPAEYLKGCEAKLKQIDKEYGNGDGKVSIEEMQIAFKKGPLAIMTDTRDYKYGKYSALIGEIDKNKILFAYRKMPEAIKKSAGQDKVYSAEEYAQLINSKEWDECLQAFHARLSF